MRNGFKSVVCLIALGFAVHVCAQQPQKTPIDIRGDTTWAGLLIVDREVRVRKGTLTIAPGSIVQFKPGGSIYVGRGCALVARGLKGGPTRFSGETCGRITGTDCRIVLEHCEISRMGEPDQHKRAWWLSASSGNDGISLRRLKITDRGGVTVAASGPFEMIGCDLRKSRGGILVRDEGRAEVARNTLDGAGINVGPGDDRAVRGNVVIGGRIAGWRTRDVVVENNYVHQPQPKGSYGLLHTRGVIRNNVIRGGSWVTAQIGGEITGNVLISLPHEEIRKAKKSFDKNCTHEHICGLVPNSRVVRNIFVGASYGAVMGIGGGTASDSVIRNNTFDMRGGGNAIYLNHLPKSNPKNVIVRNNIFIRSGAVLSEKPIHDTFSTIDYNLWSKSGLGKRRGRFWKITMTGKKEGDAGFGAHDVPPYGKDHEQPTPDAVVVNPGVSFPFSDEDMLSGRHTVAEVLKHYRAAYALKADSPAIDAGDPQDKDDPTVTDGKPDIGAVEFVKE